MAHWLRSIGVDDVLGGEFEEDLTAIAAVGSLRQDQDDRRARRARASKIRSRTLRGRLRSNRASRAAASFSGAGSQRAAAAGSIRHASHAGWHAASRRVHRCQPRLQASLPALSDRPGLRGTVPDRAARGRAGGRRRPGGGWRRAHHLRRSRFLQRPGTRHAHRRRICTPRIRTSPTTSRSRSSTCCSIATCCRGCATPDVCSSPARWNRSTTARWRTCEKVTRGATSSKPPRCAESIGLTLVPTFVAFHPWLTLEGYCDLLDTIAELDLVDHVPPIQLAIRLLIPEGSKLLELDEVKAVVADFDPATLAYRLDASRSPRRRRWAAVPIVQHFDGTWFGPFDVPSLHMVGIAGFGLLSASSRRSSPPGSPPGRTSSRCSRAAGGPRGALRSRARAGAARRRHPAAASARARDGGMVSSPGRRSSRSSG